MTEEVSIKEYFDARINALEKATTVAANSLEKRLEGMNEFRSQLKDQQSTLMPRTEFNSLHTLIVNDIQDLKESRAELRGKASQKSVIVAYIISGISLVIAVIEFIKGM